jgi:predicted transcriptional regulator
MNESSNDKLNKCRELCKRLLAQGLKAKKDKVYASLRMIEQATSIEQAREIAGAVINARKTRKGLDGAISGLIEKATVEQLRPICTALIATVLKSNRHSRQLDNTPVLMEKQGTIKESNAIAPIFS